jgi:hypothetical protein
MLLSLQVIWMLRATGTRPQLIVTGLDVLKELEYCWTYLASVAPRTQS